MDLRAEVETGKMTLLEATELSRVLEEKWGVRPGAAELGDWPTDFILPLLYQTATGLSSPEEHLATVRASLARARSS